MNRNTAIVVALIAFLISINVVPPLARTLEKSVSSKLEIKQLELRVKELELEVAKCTQGENHETKTFNHSTNR
jgi:hypothetical protein